jgi:large subunit ribosomal protein L5e
MGFVKVIKNNAYYKRYQVQFRRRREAKTDYYARKRLIWVDKNKYDAPKYRYVVRFSNRDVICCIVASDLSGDKIVASAYGHELARYGVKFGYNNWAAAYAAGFLLARKVNLKYGLPYIGQKDVAEKYYNVVDELEEDDSKRRPFQAVLDVGLHRTTTGARIFAALKGICDGGVNVPHSTRRFPGTPKGKDQETDFSVVRKYIFGGYVAEYMNSLAADEPEQFATQFAVAKANNISGDDLEKIYQSVHDKIRAETAESLAAVKRDPKALGYFKKRTAPKQAVAKDKYKKGQYYDTKQNKLVYLKSKMSKQQRKARILAKLQKYLKPAAAAPAAAAPAAAAKSGSASGSGSGSGSGSDSE